MELEYLMLSSFMKGAISVFLCVFIWYLEEKELRMWGSYLSLHGAGGWVCPVLENKNGKGRLHWAGKLLSWWSGVVTPCKHRCFIKLHCYWREVRSQAAGLEGFVSWLTSQERKQSSLDGNWEIILLLRAQLSLAFQMRCNVSPGDAVGFHTVSTTQQRSSNSLRTSAGWSIPESEWVKLMILAMSFCWLMSALFSPD